MKKQSVKQQMIYEYIVEHVSQFGYPPTVREIGDAVGLRSPSTVHFHLRALEVAGLIVKDAGKTRAITVNPCSDGLLRAEPVQKTIEKENGGGAEPPKEKQSKPSEEPAVLKSNPQNAPEVYPYPKEEFDVQKPDNQIPVLGKVAAGAPILAQELVEDYLTFDTIGPPEEYFALRVQGDSMINAGILPGDLLVVRKQHTARHGEIVIALIEDEATVKRLYRQGGRILLLPENDDYDPIDGSNAEILGKVAAVVRRY